MLSQLFRDSHQLLTLQTNTKKYSKNILKHGGKPFFDPIIFAFLILQNSVFLNTWWLRPASRTLPHSEPKLWTCRVWHFAYDQRVKRKQSVGKIQQCNWKKFIQIPWKFSWSSLPNKCKFHATKTRWNTSLLIWRTDRGTASRFTFLTRHIA